MSNKIVKLCAKTNFKRYWSIVSTPSGGLWECESPGVFWQFVHSKKSLKIFWTPRKCQLWDIGLQL